MATQPEDETIRLSPPKYVPHLHTIIMLHDIGSNGSECRDELFSAQTRPLLGRPRTLNKMYDCCRWVFPNAPYLEADAPNIELDVNAVNMSHPRLNVDSVILAVNTFSAKAPDSDETVARQWFDTPNMWKPQDSPGQHPALERSIKHVLAIVEEEEKHIGRNNIFIGGFGQGFAVAAGAFLVDGTGDFAGLIGLNGWLPFSEQLVGELDGQPPSAWMDRARTLLAPNEFPDGPDIIYSSKNTPIFLAHPNYDLKVPLAETLRTSEVFQAMGWANLASLQSYDSAEGHGQPNHGINAPRGITHLSEWLRSKMTNCPGHP